MKLYHSSTVAVPNPDTVHSRDYLDFGKGFYLTSIYSQAVKYAQRFIRRSREAWLNSYEFECDLTKWKVLQFDAYNKEWLQFVAECRAGNDVSDFDIVIGGIANDKVTDIFYKSETASLIEDGVADLQCRSDKYLATIILEEYYEKNSHH